MESILPVGSNIQSENFLNVLINFRLKLCMYSGSMGIKVSDMYWTLLGNKMHLSSDDVSHTQYN